MRRDATVSLEYARKMLTAMVIKEESMRGTIAANKHKLTF